MTAIIILIVAGLLAFGYYKLIDKADGATLQTLGLLVFAPWVLIVLGAIIALVTLT